MSTTAMRLTRRGFCGLAMAAGLASPALAREPRPARPPAQPPQAPAASRQRLATPQPNPQSNRMRPGTRGYSGSLAELATGVVAPR